MKILFALAVHRAPPLHRLLSPSGASTCGQVIIPSHLSADRGLVGRYLTRWEFSLFSGRPIGGRLRISIFHFHFAFGFWQLSATNIRPSNYSFARTSPPNTRNANGGARLRRAWQREKEAGTSNRTCWTAAKFALCLCPLHNASGELKLPLPHSFIVGEHLWHIVLHYDGMGGKSNSSNNKKQQQQT